MFKINNKPTFKRTVDIPVPADGGHDTQTLDVTFRVLDDEEMGVFNFNTAEGTKDFLRRAIVSMDDLVGLDKKPVAYNENVREEILSLTYARPAILAAYNAAMVPSLVGN